MDRGHDLIEKTVSTIIAINKKWPREVVKLFLNIRFFSKLKEIKVSSKDNSKKMSKQ